MLPLLVLCTLCPVYIVQALQALGQACPSIAAGHSLVLKCLVPTANSLMMKLVMGRSALAYRGRASCNHVAQGIALQGNLATHPSCSLLCQAADAAQLQAVASGLAPERALHSPLSAKQCCPT